LNLGPPEYEARALTTRPRCSVQTDVKELRCELYSVGSAH
jgi:hypothetical protein